MVARAVIAVRDTAVGKAGAIQGHGRSRHSRAVLPVDCLFRDEEGRKKVYSCFGCWGVIRGYLILRGMYIGHKKVYEEEG
jgi:hypothetical protein